MDGPVASRRAVAFAPAHVTGVFSPDLAAADPRARGSLGAGVVLGLGVTAEARWRASPRSRVRVGGELGHRLPISEEAARRLLASRPGLLEVRLRHEVPIGQGFGSSAAGALATALAVAAVLDLPRSRAVEIAHLADLFGGGGLGGVAAVLGGGLEVRVRAGVPPRGKVVHLAYPAPLLVGVVGRPVPSPRILGDPKALARIRAAARGLPDLAAQPGVERFWDESERFTDRAGLASPEVRAVVRGLRRRGARAAQAMFGNSFFAAVPPRRQSEVREWLTRRGVSAIEVGSSRRGARLLPRRPSAGAGSAATLFLKRPSRRHP
jgi:pantoate kinase